MINWFVINRCIMLGQMGERREDDVHNSLLEVQETLKPCIISLNSTIMTRGSKPMPHIIMDYDNQ